jgi:hypothetical protein
LISLLSFLKSRVLKIYVRRIFGPKRDEVTGEWRKIQSEGLHVFYSSPNVIRQMKSRRMRWGGGMWYEWERRENCTRFWWETPKERDILQDRGVDGTMESEWIEGRLAGGC